MRLGDSKKMKRKIYHVTGATGCIGSWLVNSLLQRGCTVHATLRNPGDPNLLLTNGIDCFDSHRRHMHWTYIPYGACGCLRKEYPCSIALRIDNIEQDSVPSIISSRRIETWELRSTIVLKILSIKLSRTVWIIHHSFRGHNDTGWINDPHLEETINLQSQRSEIS